MGADCCGVPAAEQKLINLTLEDPSANGSASSAAAKAGKAGPSRTFAEVAAEKKPYYDRRVQLFEQYKVRQDAQLEAAKAAAVPIKVTMPDGSVREAVKDVTTPLDIAKQISNSLAKRTVVAKVDGSVWDCFRPLEADCKLELKKFDDPEGKDTFWHSSSHVLGEVLELEFGADLTIGPAIEEGFYYDCFMEDRSLSDADRDKIEGCFTEAVKEGQNFERVVVTRDEALAMFQENKFKVEIIGGLPPEATISLYRCGRMVDLCRGPHVPNTGLLKAFAVHNMSRAFWRADVKNAPLQRVYGVSFPDDKLMKEYKRRMEEAKARDHRTLGTAHELFFFHPLSPGSCFFQPNGARIYNSLVEYIREKYWEYEYEEVVTPNIFNFDLWKTSGHAAHYKDNMFCIDIEKAEFGLKPMNCPGHCLIFANRVRSYRELPLRLADFGVLHRNEFSGALHGLTRVRRFQQDDAHIFCRPDQVMAEVTGFLRMLGEVYNVFGLEYKMALSTRPEDFMGDEKLWDRAEAALTEALNSTGQEWELNPGDGAFYGPKIDITVFDALRRKFQCATVQLDFQLPERFGLEYQNEAGLFERPVIVHRAILGSVERMFAILTEHFASKWPLWLNPRQVMIVPVGGMFNEYAQSVRQRLRAAKFHVDVNAGDKTMQNKVRMAQTDQYNYILVVGEKEQAEGTVNVRTRDNVVHGMRTVDELLAVLTKERDSRALESAFGPPPAGPAKAAPQPKKAAQQQQQKKGGGGKGQPAAQSPAAAAADGAQGTDSNGAHADGKQAERDPEARLVGAAAAGSGAQQP